MPNMIQAVGFAAELEMLFEAKEVILLSLVAFLCQGAGIYALLWYLVGPPSCRGLRRTFPIQNLTPVLKWAWPLRSESARRMESQGFVSPAEAG